MLSSASEPGVTLTLRPGDFCLSRERPDPFGLLAANTRIHIFNKTVNQLTVISFFHCSNHSTDIKAVFVSVRCSLSENNHELSSTWSLVKFSFQILRYAQNYKISWNSIQKLKLLYMYIEEKPRYLPSSAALRAASSLLRFSLQYKIITKLHFLLINGLCGKYQWPFYSHSLVPTNQDSHLKNRDSICSF